MFVFGVCFACKCVYVSVIVLLCFYFFLMCVCLRLYECRFLCMCFGDSVDIFDYVCFTLCVRKCVYT